MPISIQLGQPAQPVDPAAQREHRRRNRFWTGAAIIVSLLSFVTILRLYAFEASIVTSDSMVPTLKRGDYFVFDHRAAIRGTWNRGDVILFETPRSWEGGGQEGDEEAGSFKGQILVKRIIGLPGETITLRASRTFINGRELEGEAYLKEQPLGEIYEAKLGDNEFWVMGDNRNYSDDSRDNGPISESRIKGRVVRILWPPGRAGAMTSPDYGGLGTSN